MFPLLTAIAIVLSVMSPAIMLGMAIVRNSIFQLELDAPSTGFKSGQLIQMYGKIWVSQNLKTASLGERVAFRSDLVVDLEKTADTDVLADEAPVSVDLLTGKVVTSGGVVAGLARGASPAGVGFVRVALNTQ